MLKPVLQDEAFLADVAAVHGQSEAFHLWWLGQSGFLLHWQEKFLLFDPYLSDSLTRKYAGTDKPHVRMTERIIAPERLSFIHVLTSSHNHTDHLDGETLSALWQANQPIEMVVPEANRPFAANRMGVSASAIHGLDAGATIAVQDFEFHAVPAAHESIELDAQGRHIYLGYVVKFGSWTVYHSGDTVRFPGMAELLRPFRVDVAILPINGSAPERRVAGNLNGKEAARLAHDIGAGSVIPCHYGMFEFNTASPEEFVLECQHLGQPCSVLRAGERWTSGSLPRR